MADRDYDGVPVELHDIWEELTPEQRTDALLEFHGAIKHGYGVATEIYTEKQLTSHMRRHEMSDYDAGINLFTAANQDLQSMLVSELEEAGRLANLTDNEMDVWKLVALGNKQADIAEGINRTSGYVAVILKRCRRKVQRAMVLHPFLGWMCVYLQEVNRK